MKKGPVFERKICRLLTLWASGKPEPLWYWRTAGSGARATRMKAPGSVQAGDLMAIDQRGGFLTKVLLVELRNRKKMNPLDFIAGTTNPKDSLRSWWLEEVVVKAKAEDKMPFAIFHRWQSKYDYCIVKEEFIDWIGSKKRLFDGWLSYMHIPVDKVYIFCLQELLAVITPVQFAEAFLDSKTAKEVASNYGETCTGRKVEKSKGGGTVRENSKRGGLRKPETRRRLQR